MAAIMEPKLDHAARGRLRWKGVSKDDRKLIMQVVRSHRRPRSPCERRTLARKAARARWAGHEKKGSNKEVTT